MDILEKRVLFAHIFVYFVYLQKCEKLIKFLLSNYSCVVLMHNNGKIDKISNTQGDFNV